MKKYKLETINDEYVVKSFFNNDMDLIKIEDMLNEYAKDGWAIKDIMIPMFMGGGKEFPIIIFEKEVEE